MRVASLGSLERPLQTSLPCRAEALTPGGANASYKIHQVALIVAVSPGAGTGPAQTDVNGVVRISKRKCRRQTRRTDSVPLPRGHRHLQRTANSSSRRCHGDTTPTATRSNVSSSFRRQAPRSHCFPTAHSVRSVLMNRV